MRCPACGDHQLEEVLTKKGVLVDSCRHCRGIWLDGGEVYFLTDQPKKLEAALESGFTSERPAERACPRCQSAMRTGDFLEPGLEVEHCPSCEGLWFDQGELKQALTVGRKLFHLEVEPLHELDGGNGADEHLEKDDRVRARHQQIAAGMMPLPNLFVRSASVLFVLYAMLGGILLAVAEFGYLSPAVSAAFFVGIVLLQFTLGPWIMDLSLRWLYQFSWLTPQQMPPHLREFVERTTAANNMAFPSIGLIHDGAPNAFTYGHTPNNMRIVVTQGILDLLEPDEVEAVVAHEIGHGKHWDMALMTIAQLVPMLLYYIYRVTIQIKTNGKDQTAAARIAIAIGAYVLYIVSEYMVLWFSRCREYHADRFAGQATGKPNSLASALVKIAYGLAARGKSAKTSTEEGEQAEGKQPANLEAIGALGIFDAGAARALVACAASERKADEIGKENLKSAMQWDLWNPWAMYYELHSTHPLVAHRLQYLGDQASAMQQEPYVVFDRRQPESYWDEFLVDAFILFLPVTLAIVGLIVGAGIVAAANTPGPIFGFALLGLGLGMLGKALYAYAGSHFPRLTVAGLLHKVKVSSVRPVPCRIRGKIIGRGVPGLIWSEDFVLRDGTGIMFLDYRQPLRIWEWLFGLLRARDLSGKEVEVMGWYRRAPIPYIEIKTITSDDKARTCYAYHAKIVFAIMIAIAGAVVSVVF